MLLKNHRHCHNYSTLIPHLYSGVPISSGKMSTSSSSSSSDTYCKVYDAQDSFTAVVQGLLAVLALASLYIKRLNEQPRRKFMVWWLDVSKQGFGATYAHCLNMVIAALIANAVRGDYQLKDQCAWYAMNFFLDTTLGLVLSLIFLGMLERIAERFGWTSLMNTGVYSGPDAVKIWFHQLVAWLFILSLVKVVNVFVLWVFSPLLARLGEFLFRPLQSNIRFELLFVMIMFPGILNVFYFWIADGYLKAADDKRQVHESELTNTQKSDQQPESITEFIAFECHAMTDPYSPMADDKSTHDMLQILNNKNELSNPNMKPYLQSQHGEAA